MAGRVGRLYGLTELVDRLVGLPHQQVHFLNVLGFQCVFAGEADARPDLGYFALQRRELRLDLAQGDSLLFDLAL
jgi:hypothetical protein